MPKTQKYAIRIVQSNWYDAEHKLFAIVGKDKVNKYRALAQKTIHHPSPAYVAAEYWN